VYGNVHHEVAESLAWIAALQERRDDLATAAKLRQEVLEIKTRLLGKDHWQVTNARLALAHVATLTKLTPAQRQELRVAEEKNAPLLTLHEQGKVRPEGAITAVSLGASRSLGQLIDNWRSQVKSERFENAQTAHQLRERLWAKLEPHLKGVTTVLISPDGPLNRFAWSALPGKERGTYLIEERGLAVIPVPQLLAQLLTTGAGSSSGDSSLLAVGDVDYGGTAGKWGDLVAARSAAVGSREGNGFKFQALEHTRVELTAITDRFRRTFRKSPVGELREDEATESAFRQEAPQHRFLHLATHGYFAPAELKSALATTEKNAEKDIEAADLFGREGVVGFHPGLLSGIALTGANVPHKQDQDDGILTATEVAGLDLRRAELVVLSACETGLGQVAGGEGVLGLQRAFQVSGARTTVATLWTIDDLASQQLMTRYYDNLWKRNLPKLEALREAQLWMLREGGKARNLVRVGDDQPKTDRMPPPFLGRLRPLRRLAVETPSGCESPITGVLASARTTHSAHRVHCGCNPA
jgi:CHAT domain-containing protein